MHLNFFYLSLQWAEHNRRSGLGDGLRRRAEEMDTVRQLVWPEQGADIPPPDKQHLPSGGAQAARPRGGDKLLDHEGAQI